MGKRQEWFESWFDEGYVKIYQHRDLRDARVGVDLLESLPGAPAEATVLDLACGAGRHLQEMRRRGLPAIGLDLSPTLLATAATAKPRPPLVRGDMRSLPFRSASFDRVTCFFTSFGYFDEAQNRETLSEIARVLRTGGSVLLDLPNRAQVLRTLRPETRRTVDGGEVIERRRFVTETDRVEKHIELTLDGTTRSAFESVRLYRPDEVQSLLAAAGFAIEARYGGHDGSPFQEPSSERLIIDAVKQDEMKGTEST